MSTDPVSIYPGSTDERNVNGVERHISSWTVDEVVSYLRKHEFSERIIDTVSDASINGQRLLLLEDDAMSCLGMDTRDSTRLRRLLAQYVDFGACSQHHEAFTVHCKEYDDLACVRCVSDQSRPLTFVTPVTEANQRAARLVAASDKIRERMHAHQRMITTLGEHMNRLQASIDTAKGDINKWTDSVIRIIEQRRAYVLAQVDKMSTDRRSILENMLNTRLAFVRDCDRMCKTVTDITSSPPVVIYRDAPKLLPGIEELATRVLPVTNYSFVRPIVLTPYRMCMTTVSTLISTSQRYQDTTDYMVVAGGVDKDGRITNSVEVYSHDKKLWKTLPSMSTPRSNFPITCVAYTDGHVGYIRIYVIGGHDGHKHLASGEYYALGSNRGWIGIPHMKVARSGASGVILSCGKKLLVCGGGNRIRGLTLCECLDITTNTWTDAASTLVPRQYHRCVLYMGMPFILGGRDPSNGKSLSSCERLDADGSWKPSAEMNTARFSFAAAAIGCNIYAAGGRPTHYELTLLTTIEMFDGNAWHIIHDSPYASFGHNGTCTDNLFILIGGGEDCIRVYDVVSKRFVRSGIVHMNNTGRFYCGMTAV